MQNEIIKLLLYWKSILRLVASESKNCSDRVTLKQNSYSILVKFHEFLGKIMFKRRYLFEFQVSVCPISRVSMFQNVFFILVILDPSSKGFTKKNEFLHTDSPQKPNNSTQQLHFHPPCFSVSTPPVVEGRACPSLEVHAPSSPHLFYPHDVAIGEASTRWVLWCSCRYGTPSTTSPPKNKKRTKIDVENRGDAKKNEGLEMFWLP